MLAISEIPAFEISANFPILEFKTSANAETLPFIGSPSFRSSSINIGVVVVNFLSISL